MEILAIANHKGGVGKTVTAVNLAAGLARAGRSTLLVDADSQAHATFWFVDDPEEVAYDLHDVIVGGIEVNQAIRATRIEGLQILPATLALARLELDLVSMPRREERLRRVLAPLDSVFEYVIIDLAPSLSLLTLAALTAATRIIAPVSATRLGISALGTFIGWMDDFRREELITAELLGVLVTMADRRTRSTREVLEALAISELPVFRTVVPRRVAVEDQVSRRAVAGDSATAVDDPVAEAYKELVGEVLEQTESEQVLSHVPR